MEGQLDESICTYSIIVWLIKYLNYDAKPYHTVMQSHCVSNNTSYNITTVTALLDCHYFVSQHLYLAITTFALFSKIRLTIFFACIFFEDNNVLVWDGGLSE